MSGTKPKFPNFTMTIPAEGPISIPDSYEFVANEALEIDLTELTFNGWIEYISGVFIDNTENTGNLYFTCSGTKQNFWFPAGYSGYVPLFLPNPPKVVVTSSANANVTFQWYNVPVFPLLLPGPNVVAPLTAVDLQQIAGVALTSENLPVDITWYNGAALDSTNPLPVVENGPTITDYTFALTGASDTLVTAGQAGKYFLLQNPTGNGTVTLNLAGGDASTSGISILAGGSYEAINGIANAITVKGTAAQSVTVFAG